MPRLTMRFLGGYQVCVDGEPVTGLRYDKVRALLAYLAMEADRPHRREALAGLLWPEQTEARARHNLSQAQLTLRRVLGEDAASYLTTTPQAIRFGGDYWVDAALFGSLLAECQAHAHWRLETCPTCARRLAHAVALYAGPFLEGLSLPDSPAFEEWQLVWRERLHYEATDALRALACGCDHRGERDAALRYAQQWISLDPWHEGAHRQLMRALALDGRRADALAQYEACRRTLRDELGVEPAAETTALYEAIRDEQDLTGLPDLSGLGSPLPNNLPAPTTPFVGREGLLAAIARLLQAHDCRLVTLVGPGGSGKTRLALQAGAEVVAAAAVDRFPDGVWFVPLVSVQAGQSIAPAVAQVLGIALSPGEDPARQLLRALRRRHLLLILDNVEHLLGAPGGGGRLADAGAVSEILGAAPGVQCLVTSRARLGLLAEHVVAVGGMGCPPERAAPEGGVECYSAAALFLERARAVRPQFAADEGGLMEVGRACRSVGGMPLAILLAASWADVLSPGEMADRVAASLDLLAAGVADLPERQRSMRAVFDASWRILSAEARAAFARLSVFRGGFVAEAAEAVAGAGLGTLRELVRTSFLQRGEEGRYEIHELLRQYGSERLAEDFGDREAALDGHCAYYAAFYRERALAVAQGEIGSVASEMADIRAAWHWALRAAHVGLVRCFVGRLNEGVFQLDRLALVRYAEGEEAFARAVEILRAAGSGVGNVASLGVALRCQARHAYLSGYLSRARSLLKESMALLEACGAVGELSISKVDAYTAGLANTPSRAEALLREAVSLAREACYEEGISRALHMLGALALHRRAFEEAGRCLRDAVALARRTGHRWGVLHGLRTWAAVACGRGDWTLARQLAFEALEVANAVGPPWNAAMQTYLGAVLAALGECEGARRECQTALAAAREWADDHITVCALCGLGDAALAEGDIAEARAHYSQAVALAVGDPRAQLAIRAVCSVAALLAQQGCLERAAALSVLLLDPAWAWSLEYGMALRLLIELEERLPPAAIEAAKERAHAMSLRETVTDLLAELEK
ncbi:MAG: tetratricopeptide repeat protein [Anaerolineae bacterium]|nr:tetratricopeptide repeat protein [Anaerolineae bacterium]